MSDVITAPDGEQFNVRVILRLIDSEAVAVCGGSERTAIQLVARLIRALRAEIERLRAELADTLARLSALEAEVRELRRLVSPLVSFASTELKEMVEGK